MGSSTLIDGSRYTSNETYSFTSVGVAKEGTTRYAIDSSRTVPDPLPEAGNCWMSRETFVGVGSVPATMRVYGYGPGDSRYGISVSSPDQQPQGAHTTTWSGGIVDGLSCSRFDTVETFLVVPRLSVFTRDHYQRGYRAGKASTPDTTYLGGCQSAFPGAECVEGDNAGNWAAPRNAQWSLTVNECSGFSKSYRLGNGDTAYVFNPCQTKAVSSRISVFDRAESSVLCRHAYVKKVLKACSALKKVSQVEWALNNWFMFNASNQGDCGVWVVDTAKHRPARIKPASRAADGQGVSSIAPGGHIRVATKGAGSVNISCP